MFYECFLIASENICEGNKAHHLNPGKEGSK